MDETSNNKIPEQMVNRRISMGYAQLKYVLLFTFHKTTRHIV